MNGFSKYLHEALIGFNAHMVIAGDQGLGTRDQGLEAEGLKAEGAGETFEGEVLSWLHEQSEVEGITAVTEFDAIVETVFGVTAGGKIRGIDPKDVEANSNLDIYYFYDETADSLSGSEEQVPGVLLGEELYTRLKFIPGDQEIVSLIFPFGDVGPTGEIEPKRREYRVVGILSTGFYDFDTRYVFVSRKEAKWLSGFKAELNQVHVRLEHEDDSAVLKERFKSQFPQASVTIWEETNRRLFEALKLERVGMFLLR